MTAPQPGEYRTLREFWPYYLGEHLDPTNRGLHVVGSLGALTCLTLALAWREPLFLIPAPLFGYGCAWLGHFFFEGNRPATFRYPFKSFACDWIMLAAILTRRIGPQLAALRAQQADGATDEAAGPMASSSEEAPAG